MKKIIALFLGFVFSYASLNYPHYWLILLHYKKDFFGNYTSLIDDKSFFVSKNGKYNPEKEFLASIKLIKTDPSKFACKFPLRYQFLNGKYHLSDFNISQCPKLQKYLKEVNPKKAVLVFADADMNKPASMFGHTFIRIDTPENLPLLSSAVNYAATVTDTNGILFAFKGIFGFYKAYYSLMPYYDKLKQYSDKDSRDLWEYELNLTPKQVRKMALHIWELKDIYSYYYFFNENCSYNILFLIDVVKPGLNTTDDFSFTVIPIDTVKDLKRKHMIKSYHYRPSLVTKIKAISKNVNKDIIYKTAMGKYNPENVLKLHISSEKKARILDASVRYLEYLSKKIYIKKSVYTKRFLNILRARSKVKYISNYHYKVPFNPVNGHGSKRFMLQSGRIGGKSYTVFGLRLAYHSLEDDLRGYKKGSSLQFGDFRFIYRGGHLKTDKIGLIEIKSISPRDELFKPVSWKVDAGFYRQRIKDDKRLVFEINPGGGFAKNIRGVYIYSLFDTDMLFNSHYQNGYSLGAGPEIGLLRYTENTAFIMNGRYFRYLLGDIHTKIYFKTLFRYSLNIQNAVGIDYKFTRSYHKNDNDLSLFYYHYF